MAIKTFIFCDRCNRDCLRTIDRRTSERAEAESGRRTSDDRSWYEGDNIDEAPGWVIGELGEHICPRCNIDAL